MVKRTTVEERRAEILETTCQVVVERGFAATRVSDVANKLGVSTGLIHYHFDSKDQLLAEAFQHAAEADLTRLEAEVAQSPDPVERLDRIFRLYTPDEAEPGWMMWIDGWGEALRSPELKAISRDLDLRWKNVLQEIVEAGVASGQFRCADASATAWRLAALLDGLGVQMTVHEDLISHEQLLGLVRTAACAELGLPADAFGVRSGRGRPNGTA